MKPIQRARITDCPHDGKHNGRMGYVVDTYPDGTSSVDMGHNICCITSGWEPIEPVRREDLKLNEEGLVDEETNSVPDSPQKKRRGRPPKDRSIAPAEPAIKTDIGPNPVKSPNTPILEITTVNNGRVSFTYSQGESIAIAKSLSLDDLRMLAAITETLTTKGGQ